MNKSKNEALVTSEDQFFDELNFLDLMEFIRRNIYIFLGCVLIGGALGLGIAFLLPAQWEASALVRIGKIGNVNSLDSLGNLGNLGSSIEPPMQLVDRINSISFKNDVLKSLGIAIGGHDVDAKMFRNSLKVKLEKSELISLTLRGYSSSIAKLQMTATINALKEIHSNISAPTINRLNQELVITNSELILDNKESERLRKFLDGFDRLNDSTFSQAALVSSVLLAREGELRDFRDRKRVLEEQLSPERTFSTDVLGRVEISSEPVFPKKYLFIAAGLFVGLLIGVFLSILRPNYFRRGTSL